jgi:hypothetical protein
MHLSRRISRRLGAILASGIFILALACAASALAGPTVTVRVEGESATLLPPTTVTLNGPEPVSNCPEDSVAAAINLAVDGNWDHGEANKGGGGFVDTILGETHAFLNDSDTWAEWVNYKWGGGICSDLLGNGDEVLMVADHEPEPFYAPTVLPLVVTGAPASVPVGTPFTVRVSSIHTPAGAFAEPGEGTPEPEEGAAVSGAGASAEPAGASGMATVTLATAGSITLRATKTGDAPSAPFVVCAYTANNTCDTTGPSGSSGGRSSAGGVLGYSSSSYKGPYAVVAKLAGLIENHHYPRGREPRVLAGKVLAHTGIASVSLRLRRSYRGRCYAYKGASARFGPAHCGDGSFFKVGTQASFSYLLPESLAPGRYVLDVEATDDAGNRTTLARGTSRVVFYVR